MVRVLDQLTEGRAERESACWQETPLETLRERGDNTGLNEYLEEIENRLLPVLIQQ